MAEPLGVASVARLPGVSRLGERVLGWLPIAGGAALAIAAGTAAGKGQWGIAAAIAAAPAFGWAALSAPAATLCVLLAALPFMVYVGAVGGRSIFLAAPLFGFAALACVVGRPAPRRRVLQALPARSYAALVAIALVTALASSEVGTAVSRVAYLVLFGLVAWALASAITSGALTRERLAWAIVAGGLLASVAVIAQFVAQFAAGRDSVIHWLGSVYTVFAGTNAAPVAQTNWVALNPDVLRGIFPFLTPSSAGAYLMMALIAAVWLQRGRRRPAAAVAGWVVVVVIAAGLLATLSRESWVGAGAGILALVLARGRGRLLAIAVPAVVLVLFVPIPGASGSFGSYLVSAPDTSGVSGSTRLELWHQGVALFGSHALLGVGPGLFETLNPYPFKPIFYAHNILLDAGVELGVAGLIALVAVLGIGIRNALRRADGLALALIVSYIVAGMFDDVLYFPRNGLLLAAAFALIARPPPAGAARAAAEPGGAGD